MASSFEIKSTRPSVGETIVTIVRDHIDYRKQIFKLAGSDLRRTYRASALGWSWAIIKPLVTIFVYWFAFAIGLRRGGDIEGYPFVLWLISGIVPWFYMSEMLTLGTECILRNRYLVTKMKYPVSTIPTFTSISKFSVHRPSPPSAPISQTSSNRSSRRCSGFPAYFSRSIPCTRASHISF